MKNKKTLIINTALKLFSENGFDATSIADICKLADVSKGSIYHYFKSKNELLIEVFEQSTRNMVHVNSPFSENTPITIADLIEAIFSQLENDKPFFLMNVNMMFQPSTRKILEKQIKERAAILFNTVKNIFDASSPENSELLSYLFIAEIDGIALNYLSAFENYPLENMKEALLKKYHQMIRKYTEEEIPRLLEIWEAAALIAHPFLSNDFHEMVKKAMKDMYLPNSDTWVYEESGNIIGFISMMNNEIGGLFVDPNQQSKGIGTSLVNHITQFHKELEVEVFEKNTIGRPFYEKCGFTIIKEYIMEETGEKVLRMKK